MSKKETILEKTIEANSASLAATLDSIQESAARLSHSDALPLTMRLLAEEAITNILRHGYKENTGTIEISAHATDQDFTIELRDQGVPFDSSLSKDGIGLQLLHAISDSIEYKRQNETNVLILKKMLS